MRLLAIDVGQVCGVAYGDVRGLPACGIWQLPKRDKRDVLAARIAELRDRFTEMLTEQAIDLVAVAEPVRSRTAAEAAHKGGLIGVIREECWRRHIGFQAQPEPTVRKHMLGRGSGSTEVLKALALEWCGRNAILVPTHDAADAAVLFAWCRLHLLVHSNGHNQLALPGN